MCSKYVFQSVFTLSSQSNVAIDCILPEKVNSIPSSMQAPMNPLRERLRSIKDGTANPPPIAKTLGINLVEIGEGTASAAMKVGARYYNPMGTVHGGILTDLRI